MKIIFKTSENDRPTLAIADPRASSAAQRGLFARAFRRALDWLAGEPAALAPGKVRSRAYLRINSHYDALGRS